MEPVFPFRFFQNRYWMGMLLQGILNGIPFTVLTVNLPQRFQSVNGLSALDVGIRLLPFSLLSPIGSLVSNIIFARKRAPITLLFISAILQVLGLALLAAEPISFDIPAQEYVFQAIVGFGLGFMFGTLLVITPTSVDPRDLSTATSAMLQMRQMVRRNTPLAYANRVQTVEQFADVCFLRRAELSALRSPRRCSTATCRQTSRRPCCQPTISSSYSRPSLSLILFHRRSSSWCAMSSPRHISWSSRSWWGSPRHSFWPSL